MHEFNLRDDNLLDNMDDFDDKFLKEDKFLTRINPNNLFFSRKTRK